MAADSQVPHRPGAYKQQNKTHKTGRHKSKGQLQKESKGRVSLKTLTKKAKTALNKQDRRNQAVQVRKNKRDEVLAKKRSRGSHGSPPFLVGIVPLDAGVDLEAVLENIKTCDESARVITNDLKVTHINIPRFKQRFSFIIPEYGNLYALLDMTMVADCVLLVASAENGVDDFGIYSLSSMFAQGLPASVLAVQGLKGLGSRKQMEAKKMIQKQLEKRLPGEKLHPLDTPQDGLLALRMVSTLKLRPLALRDYRPHLLAESVSFELPDPQSSVGTLKVSGYVRSKALSVNQLVHLPGVGDFQMTQIDAPPDPYPVNIGRTRHGQDVVVDMDASEVKVLEKANVNQQTSLVCEVCPDPMEGEQTWPTDEELAEAERQRKVVKRVPKGTSEYQAAWIVDSGDEQDDDESEDEGDDMAMDFETRTAGSASEDDDMEDDEQSDEEEEEEYEEMTLQDAAEKYDATIDVDEERRMLDKYKEARVQQMFPDEIDTPIDTPARVRFQKYRGLKSFRTSPWDPKENLPLDYARIFQFENYRRARKRVLAEDVDNGAQPGWYVTLHIANVPRTFMESYQPGLPVLVYGILPHEQKMSVIHFLLKRHHGNAEPIKSKERMIFHVGYRRYAACPIYSQHTNASKHKYERFFSNDAVTVATVYAPIILTQSSVMMFKETQAGVQELIATGGVLSVNPDRVVVKRTVLSGHPFKINRRAAVIRYLFFNREDIQWFKPIELRTKWGRRGHIKEPLGTHGHMKCIFDKQLTSMDTVLLTLYKRVFPKWLYDPAIAAPPTSSSVPTTTALETAEEFFD